MTTLLLIVWALLWAVGGIWLAQALFCLPRRESWPIGLGIGLVVENWLANFLARLMPLPAAAWTAAGAIGLLGLTLAWLQKGKKEHLFRPLLPPWQLALALLILTGLFALAGRGLGIFDDYQNLPTVSLMAAGDVPPHFALNPDVRFGYHYFLLLIAAQVMRLGQSAPWNALDLTRSFVMALTLVLAGLWTRRLTRSSLAQGLAIWFVALSGGVRWLLLLVPPSLVARISKQIQLLGSAAQSGNTLAEAINAAWKIEGSGPFPFPFAFVSGLNNPLIMLLGGFGTSHILLVLLLILLAGRTRKPYAGLVFSILLASLALSNEVTFALLYAGLALAGLVWLVYRRKPEIPSSLWQMAIISLVALLFAFVQGGMLTEVARKWLQPSETLDSSYFEVGFQLAWPPQFISAHLGPLHLSHPMQAFIAFLEIGPQIFVLPLLFIWGWKALKRQKWMEAGLIASAIFGLFSVFVKYEGTAGVTATTRLYGNLLIPCLLYAVPLFWLWSKRKKEEVKTFLLASAGLATFGGSVLLAIQVLAAPQPVYAPFLTEMDAKMFAHYWDKLPTQTLVFDPVGPRAPTIFGRPTRSNDTWYRPNSEWSELLAQPDPQALQQAGFDYIYTDKDYYKEHAEWLDQPCVILMQEVSGSKQQFNGTVPDYRRLLDIRDCP
jgi:hypothetical protein